MGKGNRIFTKGFIVTSATKVTDKHLCLAVCLWLVDSIPIYDVDAKLTTDRVREVPWWCVIHVSFEFLAGQNLPKKISFLAPHIWSMASLKNGFLVCFRERDSVIHPSFLLHQPISHLTTGLSHTAFIQFELLSATAFQFFFCEFFSDGTLAVCFNIPLRKFHKEVCKRLTIIRQHFGPRSVYFHHYHNT